MGWDIETELHRWRGKRCELLDRLERATEPQVRREIEGEVVTVDQHIARLEHLFVNYPGDDR